jgi:hypothetical protein
MRNIDVNEQSWAVETAPAVVPEESEKLDAESTEIEYSFSYARA